MPKPTSDDWATPKVITDAILDHWGLCALDPCSAKHATVKAAQRWRSRGTVRSWDTAHKGLVYVNPPYGNDAEGHSKILPWVEKILEEEEVERLVLVPSGLCADACLSCCQKESRHRLDLRALLCTSHREAGWTTAHFAHFAQT